ncbi:MAG: hypothetical protein WDO15_15285 [Bacteroidota bacterium]
MDRHKVSRLYLSIDNDSQVKAWLKDIDKFGLKGYHARANKKIVAAIKKIFF